MFTGIIEVKGKVISNTPIEGANRLIVASDFDQLQIGESIALNGVCLTLIATELGHLSFDVSPETLNKTTLSGLIPGEEVNLERAMLASMRFGGHYVSGHVDTMSQVQCMKPLNEYIELTLGAFVDTHAMLYLIPKGSITVEGVSLTINEVNEQSIKLMLIPHTLVSTTLSFLKVGQKVNIEFDYLARIVAHQLRIAGKLMQ